MYRRTGNLRFLCAHVLKRSLFEISRFGKNYLVLPAMQNGETHAKAQYGEMVL